MHKEIIRSAKESYKNIGTVWSPTLKDHIIFNNIGFTHLLRKNGALRTKSEQKRRLRLIADLVEIITNPDAYVIYNKKPGVDFWKFTYYKDETIIKVIIRQFEGGNKHFLSVYSRKQKSAPKS
jgi:hypothetical protein